MPKIKNILIFLGIAAVFVGIYIYFIKPKAPVANLVSSTPLSTAGNEAAVEDNPQIAQDFLNLLLSVKSIKLNDAIFSDEAFISLHDSSIVLIPDGNEGRINPFAPIGSDAGRILTPTCISPKILDTETNTCVNPPLN